MKFQMPDLLDGYRLFHDGQKALSRVEANGIRIDVEYLDKALAGEDENIERLVKEIQTDPLWRAWRKRFGPAASLTSDVQLGQVLLASGLVRKGFLTATGRLATDEHSLSKVDSPFVRKLVEIRKHRKASGTYLKGLRREVDDDGLLHPSYNLASGDDEKGGAASFRSSANLPNFQNIPVRNKMMRDLIRRVFVARRGRMLVERDFSGVEVRMACAYTHDPRLIKEFTGPSGDPHGDTACQLFLVKKSDFEDSGYFKKTLRDLAKNQFVFQEFYGGVYFQSAPAIWELLGTRDCRLGSPDGIPVYEHLAKKGVKELGDCSPGAPTRPGTFVHLVKEVEDDFWQRRFKVYTQWKKDWYEEYCRKGWFPLYTGFVCRGYYRRNQVLNYSIQGSAFHCLLWALIEIDKEIRRRGMKTLLVGQIHDSLLADVPDGEVQEYLDLSQEVMSKRLPKHWPWINVPIDTEVDVTPVGGSWLDKEEWVRRNGRWRPGKN